MSTGRVYPVKIGTEVYSALCQTDPERLTHWHGVLADAREMSMPVLCQCRPDENLPLFARNLKGTLHLQSYPHKKPLHHPSCRFYSGEDQAEAGEDSVQMPTRRRLVIPTLARRGGKAATDQDRPSEPETKAPGRSGADYRTVGLGEILRELWEEAGLNQWEDRWKGHRTIFTVLGRLRGYADQLELYGQPLSLRLAVGGVHEGEAATAQAKEQFEEAAKNEQWMLVAGKLAAFKQDASANQRLRLRNFHGLPWIVMTNAVDKKLRETCAQSYTAWEQGKDAFALVLVKRGQREQWFALDAAMLATDERFMPIAGTEGN